MNTNRILAVAVMVATFAGAHATTYRWSWDGVTGPYSAAGGAIESLTAEYNSSNQNLKYNVTFGNAPGTSSRPNGYWLAMSSGPNPKGVAGELALFYFDASRSTPVLTAYGYNGQNDGTSWMDGSPASGTQAPDKIATSKVNGSSWINNLSVSNSGSHRTMSFDINASVINGHSPLYPDTDPFKGAQFANNLGLWFHPLIGMSTNYNSQTGFLSSFSHGASGYLDLNDQPTEVVPEPFTVIGLVAGLAAVARRRK